MTLKDYWRGLTAAEKRELAERCGVTVQYLRNLASEAGRTPGPRLALRLSRATSCHVRVQDLRPQDYEGL